MHPFVLPLLLAVACTGVAHAQAPAPAFGAEAVARGSLSHAAALELVLRRNPELSAAGREIGAQDGAVAQAGARPNPELSALVEDTRSDTRTTTIQLSQPIELGGKRAARVAAAQRGRDVALAELAARRGELRAATYEAFHELLAAQERHRLAGEAQALADSVLDAAAKRVTAGKNSPVDATRARVAAAGARIELAQADGDLAAARKRLATLWGGGGEDFGRAEGRLDAMPDAGPLGALLQRLQQSPRLLRARSELDKRQALSQVERARRTPDIAVSVGAKRDEQLARTQATFGLTIPLPVFDRNQGNLHEALQRADKARDELSAAGQQLASELEQAHGRLAVARTQAELLRQEILPGAHSAYEAARKGFDFGKFNFLDVIDAQRTLLQAQTQHLRALADGHRAAADIERILGEPADLQHQDH